jgi:hypothetical protein
MVSLKAHCKNPPEARSDPVSEKYWCRMWALEISGRWVAQQCVGL